VCRKEKKNLFAKKKENEPAQRQSSKSRYIRDSEKRKNRLKAKGKNGDVPIRKGKIFSFWTGHRSLLAFVLKEKRKRGPSKGGRKTSTGVFSAKRITRRTCDLRRKEKRLIKEESGTKNTVRVGKKEKGHSEGKEENG